MGEDELFGRARLLVLYDGSCGVCARAAEWVRARDPAGRMLTLPSQTPGLAARMGLTRAQVDASVWVVTRDGRRHAGADALNRILAQVDGWPWRLLARLYALPGIGPFEERMYAWFASRRGRLARWGVTPACERPGAVCEDPGG